jgi:iron complex outermembrane receptor protein
MLRHLFGSAAVLAIAAAAPAIAQTADKSADKSSSPPPAAQTGSVTVGEVVVTARKTEEKLRDVPATVSVITAAQLQATGPLNGTGDLLRTVPGVRFNDLQAGNLSEISIRGSGTERATGADSGVGLFVNGAYVGSSTLGGRNFKNIDFFDLDRVEVDEGPQGALYGRNSEYGVVNLVSAKPSFNSSGYVNEAYTAKIDQNNLSGVVNYAINDDVAVRVGAETIGQTKGFYFNPDDNKYYDQTNGWLARAQVRYRHGPLDVDLLIDAQDLTLPVFVNDYALAPNVLATIPLGYTSNRFNVPSDGLNSTEQSVQRGMLLATLDLGFGELASTTMVTSSYSLQNYGSPFDLATEAKLQSQNEIGAWPFSQVGTNGTDHTVYQDLHMSGKAFESSLNWLAGVEYLGQNDYNSTASATSPCTLAVGAGVCGGTPTTPQCYLILPTSKTCPAKFPLAFGAISATTQRYNSEAVYGSLRYKIKKFTFSVDLRYTNDDKNATQFNTALYTGVATKAPTTYPFKAGRLSYTVNGSYKLPWKWDDLLYVKIGTGYRAGGVNNGVSSPFAPIPFRPQYGDEDTISYEAGFKGDIGRHVYVTLDGYVSSTDNAITAINDGCTVLNACKQAATIFDINGGTVHAHGIEAAVNAAFDVAGGKLSLAVNGANQHANFASLSGSYAGLPVLGSMVAQTPVWTSSATIDYSHRITGGLDGFAHAVYSGQSGGGQDTVTSAAPFDPMSSVADVSLRVGVKYQKLEAAIFVQNLTDETVPLLKFETATGVNYAYRYNEPRTIGANLIYRW